MKYATLTKLASLAKSTGLFLIYSARRITKAPTALIQYWNAREIRSASTGKSTEYWNPREYRKVSDRSTEYWNPREIRQYVGRSVEIHHPYDLRRAPRGLTKFKAALITGAVLMIYIARSFVFAPLAGLMAKGYLFI